jgi:pantothenate kinase
MTIDITHVTLSHRNRQITFVKMARRVIKFGMAIAWVCIGLRIKRIPFNIFLYYKQQWDRWLESQSEHICLLSGFVLFCVGTGHAMAKARLPAQKPYHVIKNYILQPTKR